MEQVNKAVIINKGVRWGIMKKMSCCWVILFLESRLVTHELQLFAFQLSPRLSFSILKPVIETTFALPLSWQTQGRYLNKYMYTWSFYLLPVQFILTILVLVPVQRSEENKLHYLLIRCTFAGCVRLFSPGTVIVDCVLSPFFFPILLSFTFFFHRYPLPKREGGEEKVSRRKICALETCCDYFLFSFPFSDSPTQRTNHCNICFNSQDSFSWPEGNVLSIQ